MHGVNGDAAGAGEQAAATVATLAVIARFGREGCVERALDLFLAAQPPAWKARAQALEALSYLYLSVEAEDHGSDFVYHGVTARIARLADAAGAARATRPSARERDYPLP